MKKLKNLILTSGILALIFSSPILMDHARDIYLEEIVTKKAMPVKYEERVIASSFQIKFKGKRYTVTNNHVCSVIADEEKAQAIKKAKDVYRSMLKIGIPEQFARALLKIRLKVINATEYSVVDKTLKIGNINRKILYNSPNHDICFLEPVGSKYFELASSVHRGEKISIIGHPRGLPQSIVDGRIVGEEYAKFSWLPKAGKIKFFRSTAISYPGNSGSPVVNRYGNVVGILFAGRSINYVNVNAVVPLDALYSELLSFSSK